MYRIAIVEDDAPVNNKFKQLLKQAYPKAHVDQFFNFETANGAIASAEFDLVVSDLDLGKPGDKLQGVRIVTILHGRQIPVLIVSGLPQADIYREVLMALDVWDYLQKPINDSDFLNKTKQALQWRQDRIDAARGLPTQATAVHAGDPCLVIDPLAKDSVRWKGQKVNLSITEIRIVGKLVSNLNQHVRFETLFDVIGSGKNKQNLRVHIRGIRSAFREIDPEFKRLTNVQLVGYSWIV